MSSNEGNTTLLETKSLLNEQELKRFQIIEQKKEQSFFEIAFCGHFSAGKSTIMNTLLGAEVLPTSPIPTSANIVSIQQGELGVSVTSSDQKIKKWTGDIPWEQIRKWGMDGHNITDMRIYAPLPFLSNSVVYDTPGIDSTDPTHQKMTVEALYTTDLIVYVMEYNHVQSETNLYFLKQLSEEHKPLMLVINQVDKHNDQELSFAQFDSSVRETFKNWKIEFLDLYYTSMKVKNDPNNQFFEFEQAMKAILFHGDSLAKISNDRMVQSLLLNAKSRIEQDLEEEITEKGEEFERLGFPKDAFERKAQLLQQLEALQLESTELQSMLEAEWKKLFQQVTVFPYSTTDLARQWLESKDQSFKVGLLFAKKKTEEEQERRLQALLDELKDKVKSMLIFHLKRSFERVEKSDLTNRQEVEAAIEKIDVEIDRTLFESVAIPKHINRDYVFTFTKEREADIKKRLQQKAQSALLLLIEGLQNSWSLKKEQIEEELNSFAQIQAELKSMEQLKHEFASKAQILVDESKRYHQTHFEKDLKAASNKPFPETLDASPFIELALPEESVIDTSWEWQTEKMQEREKEKLSETLLAEVEDWLLTGEHSYSLKNERESLLSRIKRHKNETFRISLFGAFSAGKSSFANALLGDYVLPVSPHPTTATINTIKRSNVEHGHNTAVLHFKSRESVEAEIQYVSKQLGEEILSLPELSKWRANVAQYTRSSQKTFVEYLLTLKNSLKQYEAVLDTSTSVVKEEAAAYIADESKACLVHAVDIYYDCPLTEKGIELIDTPGVNSIHGRHTNVAFTQLKNSDAVFYLTYYNHAFSKADQWFLQQVAKVNEGFSEDKIYFVLNAADLASSERELNGVKKHVYDELKRNGMMEPRLYHLSSKRGLSDKRGESETSEGQSFAQFEQQFYQETIEELKALNNRHLYEELVKYQQKVTESIAFMNSEIDIRQQKLAQLKTDTKQLVSFIEAQSMDSLQTEVTQELQELMVYLRERMTFILSDGYTESINITSVNGKTKKEQQTKLVESIREWKSEAEWFLQKELEATIVRLELAVSRSYLRWQKEMEKEIQKRVQYFNLPTDKREFHFEPISLDSLIEVDPNEYKQEFKSLKHFFEEGGTRQLKEVLVDTGAQKARETIRNIEGQVIENMALLINTLHEQGIQHISQTMQQEVERFESLFSKEEQVRLEKEMSRLLELNFV
ncbi:hypothetical protein AJ85_11525 [Alkalihalobacillus alcalophilus ATCC 27647 = CGMCC 1.3604]|uniref:Dynamin N-terminal domain-containing protein n=1 Tax=Alkalihalobacillus alcalophilus ATCC 27647 = CGMCC 1.3604 TaxID=1218173 RepID=A0A4S4JYF7_ALKAL|nr:dynamin family protein [Alkalihalobacillus alcalophilus]MED1563476.1 dynamin family protein [Alkalihalobacillus alcalophilus]THG90303.1 hypothetical protein AJ85_11525 [Alkalihalobacillus alcalophilus ATCC 27647 = CGMCC 1.3604]